MYETLAYLSAFSPVLPIIILTINLKRVTVKNAVTLFLFLLLPLISDWSCYFSVVYFEALSCNPIIHLYTLCIGLVISLLYSFELNSKKAKGILVVFSLLLLITVLLEFIIDKGYMQNNIYSFTFLTVYSILLSMYYFYSILIHVRIDNIIRHPFFWINSAILIYYGATFSITIFVEFVRSDDIKLTYSIWPIQLITTIIYNILISIGLWNLRKT